MSRYPTGLHPRRLRLADHVLPDREFGRLIIIRTFFNGEQILAQCRCRCGKQIVVEGTNLKSGNTQSCGCKRVKPDSVQVQKLLEHCKRVKIIMTGRYGRWTVIGEAPMKNHSGQTMWLCRCDCGTKRYVSGPSLRGGCNRRATQSCGCYRTERTRERSIKHGRSNCSTRGAYDRTYSAWMAMLGRCRQKKSRSYERYGGRGINVCERWQGDDGFVNFLADMGDAPLGMSLDRHPDVNGNYEPGNCRWATIQEQNRNRRTNHFLTYNGERRCLAEWAEILNVPYHVIQTRATVLGWPAEKIIETPWRPSRRTQVATL